MHESVHRFFTSPLKNQEKYRMSTSRRNQLAGRKTLPKNTRRKKKRGRKMLRIIMIPLLILLLFLLFKSCIQKKNQYADVDATQPEMDVQLLDINPFFIKVNLFLFCLKDLKNIFQIRMLYTTITHFLQWNLYY